MAGQGAAMGIGYAPFGNDDPDKRIGPATGLRCTAAVMKVRSLRPSGDLEEYCVFHRLQEFTRNHAVLHADGNVLG